MIDDFLPIDIEMDSVVIERVNGGWEITFKTADGEEFYHWTDMPDGMYDQFAELGYIEVDE